MSDDGESSIPDGTPGKGNHMPTREEIDAGAGVPKRRAIVFCTGCGISRDSDIASNCPVCQIKKILDSSLPEGVGHAY